MAGKEDRGDLGRLWCYIQNPEVAKSIMSDRQTVGEDLFLLKPHVLPGEIDYIKAAFNSRAKR